MSSSGGRRSSHVSMACDQCFRMKVRCDGASPSCASCTRLQQKCTYLRIDKRKMTKGAIAQLLDRVRLLENTLQQHNIPIPALAGPKGSAWQDQGDSCMLSDAILSADSPSLLLDRRSSIPGKMEEQTGKDERERVLLERMDRGSSLSPGLDPDIELLVKRTGSLQITEQGQLKYFGATSNVHFLKNAIPFYPHITHGDTPEQWLNRTGVGHIVPPEVEDHLIRLYFTWENPYFNVVERESFMETRRRALAGLLPQTGPLAPCYSQLLVNAICSWGATFTDKEFPGLPSPLHDFFISRARALLERDIDNPTIATVQALTILSGSEASRSRDSRGWLYMSMASQLARHLGLHLDAGHYVLSNEMSQQEFDIRSTAFWGTYVVDLAWSYYLGRLTVPVADVNRIPVKTPCQTYFGPPYIWEHYVDGSFELHTPIKQYVDPVAAMWEHQLKLCFAMERLQRAFYDTHTGSMVQLQVHTAAATATLEKWLSGLPPELIVDTSDMTKVYLPHILVLHLQYHEAMIFANHPFVTLPQFSEMADSRRKYTEAAREITRIVRIYDRLWTLRRINIQAIHHMFTACMVHLYVACTSGNQETHAMAVADFEVCCSGIKETAQSYPRLAAWQLRSIDRVRQVWYDMLENQSLDQTHVTELDSPSNRWPQGYERWVPIETAIQNAMVPSGTASSEEGTLWLDTWMQMQSISAVDPFSMGSA